MGTEIPINVLKDIYIDYMTRQPIAQEDWDLVLKEWEKEIKETGNNGNT